MMMTMRKVIIQMIFRLRSSSCLNMTMIHRKDTGTTEGAEIFLVSWGTPADLADLA